MNQNKLIIEQFNLLVNQIKYEISNNNLTKSELNKLNFKLRHFKKIIGIIKNYPDIITDGNDLSNISGIGKGTINRINEILSNKKLKEVNISKIKTITKKNNIIKELSDVINIGSKIAKELYNKHNITSVAQLKKKIKNGEIEVNDKIKLGLKYHGVVKLNIPRKEMDKYNNLLKKYIKNIDSDLILTVAGSYRRGKKTSNDIDILITHSKIKTDNEYKKIKINYLTEFIKFLKKNYY